MFNTLFQYRLRVCNKRLLIINYGNLYLDLGVELKTLSNIWAWWSNA